jgi:hypothetical protein
LDVEIQNLAGDAELIDTLIVQRAIASAVIQGVFTVALGIAAGRLGSSRLRLIVR